MNTISRKPHYRDDGSFLTLYQPASGLEFSIVLIMFSTISMVFILGWVISGISILNVLLFIFSLFFTVFCFRLGYTSLTSYQIEVDREQKTIRWKSIDFRGKQKSRHIPFSEIENIEVKTSDELYGGTSEREMYDVYTICFLLGSKEKIEIGIKANQEFKNLFANAEELSNHLRGFLNI